MSPEHLHRVFGTLTLTRNCVHVVAAGFSSRFRIALSERISHSGTVAGCGAVQLVGAVRSNDL
jgi:hypothetical protein